jgi:hypothetical protein
MQWLLSNLSQSYVELENMIQKWQWQRHVQRRVSRLVKTNLNSIHLQVPSKNAGNCVQILQRQ